MSAYFISRHRGAVDWAKGKGIEAKLVGHLDTSIIKAGDRVLGTLPVSIAAEVCERGGRYFHLSLNIPENRRGDELSAEDMEKFGAKLEEFVVRRV